MQPPPIAFSPTSLLHPNALWIILVIAIAIFAFISVILTYHWIKFSLNPAKATLFTAVYSVVSILIIIMAVVSLSYYQLAY